MSKLTNILLDNKDEKYKIFSKKLIPDTSYPIIGVRVPIIKTIAKRFKNDEKLKNDFIKDKHLYYEEYFLHGLLIATEKDNINWVFDALENFLPLIDNWAICDSCVMAMKIFNKNKGAVLNKVKTWLKSSHPYTVRFALVTLLSYFTSPEYCDEVLSIIKNVKSERYYVNMALAWLISVMLIKNYDKTLGLFTNVSLEKFVHNKSIQKAIESFRIPNEQKLELRKLKI